MSTSITSNPSTKNQRVDLTAISGLMSRIGLLERDGFGRPHDEQYFASLALVKLGLFRLVVVGEIKKGKSSFINALCAIPNLVPVHSDVATSTVFKLRYGVQIKYTVYFKPADNKEVGHKEIIPAEEVNNYGTETGNPDNVKNVDFIAVEAPSLLLKSGLIIIDTPGVGGLFKKHREITFRHAPRSDGVFFVTDSVESPIGSDEVKFLKELRQVTPLVYFVQTKAAQADPDTRQRRMENNLSILTEKVGIPREEIQYFVVDSGLKIEADSSRNKEDLELSGFRPLMAYFNLRLKPQREKTVASLGLRRARLKLDTLKSDAGERKRILDADTAEKQQRLQSELEIAEKALADWNGLSRQRLLIEFQSEIQDINSDVLSELTQKLRPGGVISQGAETALHDMSGGFSSNAIYENAYRMIDSVRAQASQEIISISKRLADRLSTLLNALAAKADASINAQGFPQKVDPDTLSFSQTSLKELSSKAQDLHIFERARTAGMGFLGGAGMAAAVGFAIGGVIPVVGNIVGGFAGWAVGGLWGAIALSSSQEGRQEEQARREVQVAIDKDLNNILTQAQAQLTRAFNKYRAIAETALHDAVRNKTEDLSKNRSILLQRKTASAQQIREQREKLDALNSAVSLLDRQLTAAEQRI